MTEVLFVFTVEPTSDTGDAFVQAHPDVSIGGDWRGFGQHQQCMFLR